MTTSTDRGLCDDAPQWIVNLSDASPIKLANDESFLFGCYRWLVNLFSTHQCNLKFLTIFSFAVKYDNKVLLRECNGRLEQLWFIQVMEGGSGADRLVIRSPRGMLFKFSESN